MKANSIDRYLDSYRGGTLATLTINGSGNSILFVINLYRCFNEQPFVSLLRNYLLEFWSCTL